MDSQRSDGQILLVESWFGMNVPLDICRRDIMRMISILTRVDGEKV